MNDSESVLLDAARLAGIRAYAPYSHFRVGAAVATELGVFSGCNVENASYGLSNCAERNAFFAAVAAGAREFRMAAVSCLDAEKDALQGERMPCGACRQVMAEFLPHDASIVIDGVGSWVFSELLPHAFILSASE